MTIEPGGRAERAGVPEAPLGRQQRAALVVVEHAAERQVALAAVALDLVRTDVDHRCCLSVWLRDPVKQAAAMLPDRTAPSTQGCTSQSPANTSGGRCDERPHPAEVAGADGRDGVAPADQLDDLGVVEAEQARIDRRRRLPQPSRRRRRPARRAAARSPPPGRRRAPTPSRRAPVPTPRGRRRRARRWRRGRSGTRGCRCGRRAGRGGRRRGARGGRRRPRRANPGGARRRRSSRRPAPARRRRRRRSARRRRRGGARPRRRRGATFSTPTPVRTSSVSASCRHGASIPPSTWKNVPAARQRSHDRTSAADISSRRAKNGPSKFGRTTRSRPRAPIRCSSSTARSASWSRSTWRLPRWLANRRAM